MKRAAEASADAKRHSMKLDQRSVQRVELVLVVVVALVVLVAYLVSRVSG